MFESARNRSTLTSHCAKIAIAMAADDGDALLGWRREFAAGETLFVEGDSGRQVYILLSGRIEISQAGERIGEVDAAEAILGEIAALTGQPRSATARALEASSLAVVPDVAELFERHPSWGERLARTLASRLLRVERRLEDATGHPLNETARLFTGVLRGID